MVKHWKIFKVELSAFGVELDKDVREEESMCLQMCVCVCEFTISWMRDSAIHWGGRTGEGGLFGMSVGCKLKLSLWISKFEMPTRQSYINKNVKKAVAFSSL